MRAIKAPVHPAAVLMPGGHELLFPVAPADVPRPVVNFLLRTILRNPGADPDSYDVEHARLIGAGIIALLHQDQPPPARRNRRPSASPPGPATLF